jgi:hypothetical protein
MGMFKLFSGSSYDRPQTTVSYPTGMGGGSIRVPSSPPPLPNPDPSRYDILRSARVGKYLVVMLRYHGCTNYEGVKVSVYRDCTLKKLKAQKDGIDPHFSESKQHHSPIARFVPTEEGWTMAMRLVAVLST